jgi:hypothetical protein
MVAKASAQPFRAKGSVVDSVSLSVLRCTEEQQRSEQMDDRKHTGTTCTDAGRATIKTLGKPKDIQQQNLRMILTWLYRWGYSTADILSDLLDRKNRSHAKRLSDSGWIQPISIKGYPTYYVLTQKGQAEAIHHSNALLEYKESNPYRVDRPKLHHNLIAQKETLKAMRLGGYHGFVTQRMFNFDKDDKPLKTPDVILIERVEGEFKKYVNELTGVEIELTPKWHRDLDMFVTNIVDDIQFGRLVRFLIISDSKTILENYEKAFRPGRRVSRWQKTGIKFTLTGEILEIPKWVPDRVFFREVGSTAVNYPTLYRP